MYNPFLYYGVQRLTVGEEIHQSKYARQTRDNKIKGIDTLTQIEKMIPAARNRLRNAPELNDQKHAELIQAYVDVIIEAQRELDRLCRIGR